MYVLDCIIGIYVPLRNNEGNQVRASLACWGLKTKLTAAWARASRLSEPHFYKTLSVLQKKQQFVPEFVPGPSYFGVTALLTSCCKQKGHHIWKRQAAIVGLEEGWTSPWHDHFFTVSSLISLKLHALSAYRILMDPYSCDTVALPNLPVQFPFPYREHVYTCLSLSPSIAFSKSSAKLRASEKTTAPPGKTGVSAAKGHVRILRTLACTHITHVTDVTHHISHHITHIAHIAHSARASACAQFEIQTECCDWLQRLATARLIPF